MWIFAYKENSVWGPVGQQATPSEAISDASDAYDDS